MTATGLLTAAGVIVLYVGALFVASMLLPGPVREGRARPGAAPVRYRLNGLAALALAAVVVALTVAAGLWSPSAILTSIGPLFLAANLFAVAASLALFVAGGGRRVRDFFMGVQVSPAALGVDLKLFSYRPSLIGLAILNLAFAFAQWERHGQLSTAMVLYQVFTLAYVANYFHFEHGMLFTWDLIEERFGLGLVWGDYVLVPFFYSLPGWFLVDRLEPMPAPAVVALAGLYVLGFWTFRGANGQKHRFKQDPRAAIWGAPPETIEGRLLVSGFWGLARKPNYTGEILMYWAWTLPCGFGSLLPYLPALWLTLFLPHRARRDDRRCRAKYGALWERYCKRVPYRLVPFVY
jgi:delta14-sterol reductase